MQITHLHIYVLPIDMLILADADPGGPSLRMDAMSLLHGQQVVGNAGCQTSCFFNPFITGKDESHINIHQHTSTYINIHQHTSTYINIHQHTSTYINIHKGYESHGL